MASNGVQPESKRDPEYPKVKRNETRHDTPNAQKDLFIASVNPQYRIQTQSLKKKVKKNMKKKEV